MSVLGFFLNKVGHVLQHVEILLLGSKCASKIMDLIPYLIPQLLSDLRGSYFLHHPPLLQRTAWHIVWIDLPAVPQ